MEPVRWRVPEIRAVCPNGHPYTIESSFDFVTDVDESATTAPAIVQMPTRCPSCSKPVAESDG